ncbi:oplophorus-luciferin 2-monooxygenase non-catalytic subunit-like [Penaeus chinensis]|uniref:oplophorus-luciferin 2-monooxygenase non-catalytic subunit-like n=1 Tax=Penaeus chinensis TaxID=139456 RepID=UPI001FB84CF0|nr:oplophorus-luciferin 2-monooxygenase non-catalytic subunit-like [Penaeus chinensis]
MLSSKKCLGVATFLLIICEVRGALGTNNVTSVQENRHARVLPCPIPEDILPCTCSVDVDGAIDMDCSHVASEEQLARVFSATIPFPNFRRLVISQNTHLKSLQRGALGETSFREIFVIGSVLQEVQEGALSNSYTTLTDIRIYSNNLSEFPFQELPLFTALLRLDLNHNNLYNFPFLNSDVLTYIDLGFNHISELPSEGFRNLSQLAEVHLPGNRIQEIHTGTFAGYARLAFVSLGDNQLTHVFPGAIQLTSTQHNVVYLHDNFLTSLDVNAIAGVVEGFVSLHNNTITTLNEESLRPLLEENVQVDLSANPLTCGCDVAWIVTDDTILDLIDDDATCFSGELLVELDPNIYIDLC